MSMNSIFTRVPDAPLAYDICRCNGVGCMIKEKCLRYTNRDTGPRTPLCVNLCGDTAYKSAFISNMVEHK